MKLLTAANRKALAPLGSEADMAVVKLFGSGRWRWYLSEFDGDDTFFGYVESGLGPDCDELAYFSLAELSSLRFPPFGLPIERDRSFRPVLLSSLRGY